MEPFIRIKGIAAPMPIDNVDTDAIIPSRETQSVSRKGYDEKLFANWRYYMETRDPKPDFILNQSPFNKAEILVAGRNFGCGSSREAAVWALSQFGIRCVIAESFGTIFRNNCVRNGLLPISLPSSKIKALFENLQRDDMEPVMGVDLQDCVVHAPSGNIYHFEIGSLERELLMSGVDEISVTLEKRDMIDKFRARDRVLRPWVYNPRLIENKETAAWPMNK